MQASTGSIRRLHFPYTWSKAKQEFHNRRRRLASPVVQEKNIYVPVIELPAAQIGAPQIMQTVPFSFVSSISQSVLICSLRL
jgi:hypothetical protein